MPRLSTRSAICTSKATALPKTSRKPSAGFASAKQGNYDAAQWDLGRMYHRGEGVWQDLVMAYVWYSVAAANGHEHAKAYLVLVKGRLNQDQLAVAQQRATQLFEKINTKKK